MVPTTIEVHGVDAKPVERLKGWRGVDSTTRPHEEFVVAEGLETTLSAMWLRKLRCGAAVLGPNLKGRVLPLVVRRIHIAADNDENGRGSVACAAKLWRERRLSVPDTEGKDLRIDGKSITINDTGWRTEEDTPPFEAPPKYQLFFIDVNPLQVLLAECR